MNGIRSRPGESALPASSSGLRLSASRAPAGRHTQSGMRSKALTSDSKPHNAAKAETTGSARAGHRAVDLQPTGR